MRPDPIDMRGLLRYDPSTGKLYWRDRNELEPDAKRWNKRYAGKEAFTTKCGGYMYGPIRGVTCSAHRVVWAIVYGEWPSADVDHINGDRTDNRLSNLRVVCRKENTRNRKIPKTNTSGSMGLGWYPDRQKWRVVITSDGKRRHLGYFSDFNEAVKARKEAEKIYLFHHNHGRVV